MSTILKIILAGSIILNIIAIWGLFHYIMYGGSPISDLKRKLTGTHKQTASNIPFMEENEKIRQEIAEDKTDSLRVIFVGASITHNWDLDKYFPNIHPVKRVLGGFAPDLLQEYKSNVLDLKPKAVVVKFCSINFRPTIPMYILRDDMEMMIQLAQTNDIIPIITTVIPPARPSARIGDFSVIDSLQAFNNWVRDYAQQNSIAMIDYAKAIENENGFLPRDCSIDPVHINEKGYEIASNAARLVIYETVGVK